MGDENPVCTLREYSKTSLEGYMNTIELPVGNNVVLLRSDTIRERTRVHLFHFSLHDQASNWLEHLPTRSITTCIDSDIKEEDISPTNAHEHELDNVVRRGAKVKERGKEEDEIEIDKEVKEIFKEEETIILPCWLKVTMNLRRFVSRVQVTRDKTNEEFTEIENNRELVDIQTTNILSQGLPRHVFNILNQTRTGKEIRDNVELLMKGSGKSLQQKKEELFDETSSNSRSHATMHNGQIFTKTVQRKAPSNVGNTGTRGTQSYRQCKEKKRVKDSQYFKDKMLLMEAKEKGAVLDAEAEAFLAIVEYEGPHAAAAFMANLSSTSGTNGATTSHVNEVHIDDNQVFDNVNHLLAHKIHQEEHLDADFESDIDDNTISYHQYQLDSKVQDVPTEVSSVSPDEISMITKLDDLRKQLDGHLKVNQEQIMVNDSLRAELARWTIKPINYTELNALYSYFVPQKELSREQVHWLPTKELATQKSNPPKPLTLFVHTHPAPKIVQSLDENLVKEVAEFMQIFDELDKEYEQCVLEKKKLQIEKKNLLIQNECLITNCIAKYICSIVLASDKDRPLSEELSLNCVRENSKVIELEAEILKQQQMLDESDKRCSFIQKNHIDLQIKFRNYKECFKKQTIGDNSHSPVVNVVFEINQLKEQLQGKDDTIKKLQTKINNMSMLNVEPTVGSFDKQALETKLTQLKDVITSVRIQNDGFKVEIVNLKRRYQELSTSNSHSRDTLTRKLSALTAEIAKLKSESLSKMHSEPIVPEKPKVHAPWMYAISSKYIVPPRRVNRAEPTPLPKKKQVTF
uniref:Retrovirus-related Pol polyprotein from transposon TNT 1-94 n=1 Tax=Tanacetum cinerariifolium TaxID=118510 RepID=A0A699GIL2_TANCI|nr:hypothetical protein [Tanacetum cinerariifolium]